MVFLFNSCYTQYVFLLIPGVKQKINAKHTLAIHGVALITVVKKIIDTLPLASEKKIEILSM